MHSLRSVIIAQFHNLSIMDSSIDNQSKIQLLQTSTAYQKQNYAEWFNEDSSHLNEYTIMQAFRSTDLALSAWQGKDFVELSDAKNDFKMLGDWNPVANKACADGLSIQQLLVKQPNFMNLRSLAAEVKIRFKIGFHSTLILFSRVVDQITGNTPVFKLIKDVNLTGIFFMYGFINPATNKFCFVKMNQITDLLPRDDPYRELEISLMDNGDDRAFIRITSTGSKKSIVDFNFCCCGLVPELRNSQVWVAGVGEFLCLREFSIQYKERIGVKDSQNKAKCICIIS